MQTRGLLALFLSTAAALLIAAPLWGGTLYVPLVLEQELDGNRLTTEVRVTNESSGVRAFSYLFLPQWSDGTVPERQAASVRLELEPHQSVVLADLVAPGERGVLEVTADAEVSVTSRLVSVTAAGRARPGVELPALTSENRRAAGETAVLQGWRRDLGQETDFYLLNLGHEAASCEVAVYRRRGGLIIEETIAVPPLGLAAFDDVLGLISEDRRNEVSATVRCDQEFHPFALTVDRKTAEAVYIAASGSGRSTLAPPGAEPPGGPPPPAVECPRGAFFEKAGPFHRPSPGKETRRFVLSTPAGQLYTRLVVDVEFVPGDWSQRPDGNHSIFWLNRTERWAGNVFGYVNVFGPDKNIAKISTNAGLPRGQIRAYNESAVFERGVRYHVHYEYDTVTRVMEAVFTADPGGPDEHEVARVTGATTAREIRTEEPGFFLYFGHSPSPGPEEPTYDWLYLNLCVQLE